MEKFWKHKSKFAAIALVLLMASVTLSLYIPVQAQELQPSGSVRLPAGVTPDVVVKTKACLSFRPNPVGIGQTILINMWISPALHRARYHTGYKVTIADPDGNEDVYTMDSYHADATAWLEYVVDQVGTWKLKFEFPGGYFPAGIYVDPRTGNNVTFPGSCYYEPASTEWQELVVQEDMVLSWPPSPLPTDYWTRPVAVEHREWASILGDFPWHGPGGGPDWPAETNKYWDTRYNFVPYVQGPNSAHIVWKRIGDISGLVGAGQGYAALTSGSGGPSVVFQGKCYQVLDLPGGESGLQCYDLRTGEMYWEISPAPLPPGGSLVGIEYTGLTTPAVPGATEQASAGASLVALRTRNGDTLVKLDRWTGEVTVNVSIVVGRHAYYRNGYVLTAQNLGGGNYRLINWTTFGSTSNFDNRIISNISWPFSRGPSPGNAYDHEAGFASNTRPISPPEVRAITTLGIAVANIKTGAEVWSKTVDIPPFDAMQAYCADHGKIAVVLMDGTYTAWDLATGNLAWKSDPMDYPWDATGFGSYGAASAYGLLFRCAYSGIYAFDWDNGDLVWKYEATSPYPYETPYTGVDNKTVYPFDGGNYVADGKVYAVNTEHTPTAPMTRGWGIHCVNATTGELVWKVMIPAGGVGGGISGLPGGIAAIADGYMVVSSTDGYMYVFGKGKSATTVTAPKTAISLGESVVIEGTVLDMSPAQPGTPCVSKESMSGWMEHLHKQLPIPADVTGVPVSLDTIDPNGNFVHIGDVTTDMSGMFSHMWTPEIPGKYTVIATFMGDDSYGSSYAETAVGVVEAPEPPPEPVTPATEPEVHEEINRAIESLTPMFLGLTVAIVVVALLVVYGIFRKR